MTSLRLSFMHACLVYEVPISLVVHAYITIMFETSDLACMTNAPTSLLNLQGLEGCALGSSAGAGVGTLCEYLGR